MSVRSLGLGMVAVLVAGAAWGQQGSATTTAPAASSTATTAPADRQPVTARVLEVRGEAQHAALDSETWRPCQVGDEYPENTILRTGVRSGLKLQLGSDDSFTVVAVDSASRVIISELAVTSDSKRVRIGVGYGRVRAGVVEGALRSDFTVDSPVATLSKRGTWDFGLYYERGTGRFEVYLLDQGLVEALHKITRERRELSPGEAVTTAMRRWVDQVQIVRNVPVVDVLGQPDVEVAFQEQRNSGLRVLDPLGGYGVVAKASHRGAETAGEAGFEQAANRPLLPGPFRRPEGFFGTGRGGGLIRLLTGASPTQRPRSAAPLRQ